MVVYLFFKYQVSDQENIFFNLKDPDLNMDAFSRPGIIDTHFSLIAFEILEMEGSVENTILLDNEEYKRFRHPQLQPLTVPIEPLSG